jgi:uncharacterized cupredoxin-like copper-binding protein
MTAGKNGEGGVRGMRKIRYVALGLFTVAGMFGWSFPAGARQESARVAVVTVTAGKPTEFGFRLSPTTIKGGTAIFKVTNLGALPHDFKVCAAPTRGSVDTCAGKVTKLLTPGSSATLTVAFAKSGTYEYLCTVSGHAAAGMKGNLKVVLTGSAAAVRYSASLNAAQERPRPQGVRSTASGAFTATLSGETLKWRLMFARLTGPATAAHIHLGVRGKSGAVVVPLCGPCRSGTSGTAKVTAATTKAMAGGKTYVNVHTKKNPNGEIRGQLGR